MKVSRLHEEFIAAARRPMTFGSLPVEPKISETPIVPVNKWIKEKDLLTKQYQFRLKEFKVEFIKQLLDYEVDLGHNADMIVTEDAVTLKLQTRDIKTVTELDREYAKHADELYRDIVYSVFDVGETV